MIKKLIIIEWYRFFIASVAVLLLLLTVANLISGFLRGNVTATDVLLNYLIELPSFILKIFPISCLTASLFSINKLKNRNELTAIFASGFSRRDFIFTIMQSSLLIAFLQILIGGFIQPLAKSKRFDFIENSDVKFRNLKARGLKTSTVGTGKIWFRSNDYFFSFSSFDKKKGVLNNISLYFLNDNTKIKKIIHAEKLENISGNRWRLINSNLIDNLDIKTFPRLDISNNNEITLSESTDDFKKIEADITTLNLFKLYDYISRLKDSGINVNEYLVMFLDKFSSTLICIILSLVSSIAIFSPNRRNSSFGKNLVFIFVLTILYWLIYDYSLALGRSSKVNPYLACFSLPTIFSFFLIFHFNRNRRLI